MSTQSPTVAGRVRPAAAQPRSTARPEMSTPQRLMAATFLIVITLSLIGAVMVLSASSVASIETYESPWYMFLRQGAWLVFGLGSLAFFARMDYRRLRVFAPLGLVAAIGLLVAVLVPGVGLTANGATRWIGFGFLRIQPAELAKLALIIFCAAFLAKRWNQVSDPVRSVRPLTMLTVFVLGLVMLQPNLGTSIIIAAIVGGILVQAGAPIRSLALRVGVGLSAVAILAMVAPYRRARMTAFLDPWADRTDTGYQTIQSLIGVANGGLTGQGLGASRAKWGFLPYAHTDFIFSIIGEELGFVGALVIVALFAALVVVGLRISSRAADPFGALLAGGITTWFAAQAFVNVGATIALLPITGVPLPFVSFGGSSLLATMAAAGLLISVARQSRADGPSDRRAAPVRPRRTPGRGRPRPAGT